MERILCLLLLGESKPKWAISTFKFCLLFKGGLHRNYKVVTKEDQLKWRGYYVRCYSVSQNQNGLFRLLNSVCYKEACTVIIKLSPRKIS